MASHTASTVAVIASLKTAVPSAQVGFIAFDLTILSAAGPLQKNFGKERNALVLNAGVVSAFLLRR
jgi:hypothetical protein